MIFSKIRRATRNRFDPRSPDLPSNLTRTGRFLYLFSGTWIGAVWYTAYVNQRTAPGSGPTLVLPGTASKQYSPDRPGKIPPWASTGSGPGGGQGAGAPDTGPSAGFTSPSGDVNPFPYGWQGSRLDQGWDGTFQKEAVAPFTGTVVVSNARDPGWRNGGYIAIRKDSQPKTVVYFAEGIRPTVHQGQHVSARDSIGLPIANPYNGTVGNIEWGPADPGTPTRPLAQAVSNKVTVVKQFYAWAQSLGLGQATSVGNAGSP